MKLNRLLIIVLMGGISIVANANVLNINVNNFTPYVLETSNGGSPWQMVPAPCKFNKPYPINSSIDSDKGLSVIQQLPTNKCSDNNTNIDFVAWYNIWNNKTVPSTYEGHCYLSVNAIPYDTQSLPPTNEWINVNTQGSFCDNRFVVYKWQSSSLPLIFFSIFPPSGNDLIG